MIVSLNERLEKFKKELLTELQQKIWLEFQKELQEESPEGIPEYPPGSITVVITGEFSGGIS